MNKMYTFESNIHIVLEITLVWISMLYTTFKDVVWTPVGGSYSSALSYTSGWWDKQGSRAASFHGKMGT